MVIQTTLFKLDGNPYYSPEFGRGGLRAVFSIQTTHVGGSGTLTVTVQHRNADETSYTDVGATSAISTLTTTTLEVSGLKEVLRIKFEVGGPGSTSAVAYVMPPPQWYPY